MSQVLAGQVWESALEARLKPLAAAIADIVDRDGHGLFASIEYLAWLTGLGERAVQKQMRELQQRGLIVATCHKSCEETPGRGHGRGQPVTYRMRADRLPEREAWAQVRARRKGERNAPIPAERVNGEPKKGERNDIERVNDGAPDPGSDPGIEPITLCASAPEIANREPLSSFQISVGRHLRMSVAAHIFGGQGGPRDPEYGESELRAGATYDDVNQAIEASRQMGKFGHSGAAYVLGVLRNRIEERRAGYDRRAQATGARGGGVVRGGGAGAGSGGYGGNRRADGGRRISPAHPIRESEVLPEFAAAARGEG